MPEHAEPGTTERLRELVDVALATWCGEGGGGFPENYLLTLDYIAGDGEQRWIYATPARQKLTTTLGQLEWMDKVTDIEARAHLERPT